MPYKTMIARFPYGGFDRADVTDWLIRTVCLIKKDSRLDPTIINDRIDDTPITIGRNRVLKHAREHEIDFLLMIDSDMKPDAYCDYNPHAIGSHKDAKPFWESSLDWLIKMRERGQPSIIAAPYCGPPPLENIYVFKWESFASDVPADELDCTLEQYSRTEAANATGIEQVAALPTGLILLDMEAVRKVPPPYCYYEYDLEHTKKESTEDVTFTRDMTLHGVPIYANWDSWAGHWKWKCVGKPRTIKPQEIAAKLRKAILNEFNIGPGETLLDVSAPKHVYHEPQTEDEKVVG